MRQSYHAYRRRVRCINRAGHKSFGALLNKQPCKYSSWRELWDREERLERMARRNFEWQRRKGA